MIKLTTIPQNPQELFKIIPSAGYVLFINDTNRCVASITCKQDKILHVYPILGSRIKLDYGEADISDNGAEWIVYGPGLLFEKYYDILLQISSCCFICFSLEEYTRLERQQAQRDILEFQADNNMTYLSNLLWSASNMLYPVKLNETDWGIYVGISYCRGRYIWHAITAGGRIVESSKRFVPTNISQTQIQRSYLYQLHLNSALQSHIYECFKEIEYVHPEYFIIETDLYFEHDKIFE